MPKNLVATSGVLFALLGITSAVPEASPDPEPNLGYVLTYKQHTYCDSTVAPACADNSTLSYCLDDDEYPSYEVKAYIYADAIFPKKYADVGRQSANDLVQNVTREKEKDFEYSFYTGVSTGDASYDLTHWTGPEGYICPSEVVYAMPKRARNVEGRWRVIVNDVHYYSQTARIETCLYPEVACRALAPCYNSACTQKYVYHRLLSWDPCDPFKGLFIDAYQLPSVCSCHIPAK